MNEADLAELLYNASPGFIFVLFIVALLKRWLILPRELDRCEKRIEELKAEKNEYKRMAFRAVGLGERLAEVREP